MSEERSTFETTKARLEDIVTQVRRKDVSLEQSLDLLEEAVRLVNQCNEMIDQTSWRQPADPAAEGASAEDTGLSSAGETGGDDPVEATAGGAIEVAAVVEVDEVVDTDGDGMPDTVVESVAVLVTRGGGYADDDGPPDAAMADDERS